MSRKAAAAAGLVLFLVGLFTLVQVPYFFARSAFLGHMLLLDAGEQAVSHPQGSDAAGIAPKPIGGTAQGGALLPGSWPRGRTLGVLRIPSIGLNAPLVEGTGEAQLSDAVGSLPGSAVPGRPGTAVLAAHNATWFRNIDRLRAGQKVIIYTPNGVFVYRVFGSRIVREGSPIANTAAPQVVLETCYPLDALYLTPYRYLVFARLLSQSGPSHKLPLLAEAGRFHPEVPEALRQQGLSVQESGIPMGTLDFQVGAPLSLTQSDIPLSAANTVEELFAAWIRASADKNSVWLKEIASRAVGPNGFWGRPVSEIHYLSSLDVTILVSRSHISGVKAVITVGADDGPQKVSLVAAVEPGGGLRLNQILFSKPCEIG